jgi:polar amino acid transport system substrate-binding protein
MWLPVSKPIEFQYYDDDAGLPACAAVRPRRCRASTSNSTQAYSAAETGKTKLVGTVSGGWPLTAEIAITTRKGSGLADSLTAAINGLIANGAYGKALARWNLTAEAVAQSRTNPPGLPKV